MLAGMLEEVTVSRNEVMFSQEDTGDSLYLVCAGSIDIIKDGQKVATLGENASLGENGLIGAQRRSATARAASDARLLRLWTKDFHRLLINEPDMARALLRTMSRRLRQLIMWR